MNFTWSDALWLVASYVGGFVVLGILALIILKIESAINLAVRAIRRIDFAAPWPFDRRPKPAQAEKGVPNE